MITPAASDGDDDHAEDCGWLHLRVGRWPHRAFAVTSLAYPCRPLCCSLFPSAVEKDEAFARRMQPVFVEEPSVEDTVSILRGIRDRYSAHHGVTILDAALVVAAKLAKRYIPTRRLPDSAIDLMDEACASVSALRKLSACLSGCGLFARS